MLSSSQSHGKNPVYQFYRKVTLDEIVEERRERFIAKEITVAPTNTLGEVVSLFAKEKILSAPVVDKKTGECSGIIDVLDILFHVVRVAPEPQNLQENELKTLEIAGRAISFETVKNVMNLSGKDTFIPIATNSPVSMALDIFASGLHRVAVFDPKLGDNKFFTVSQTDIINSLNSLWGQTEHQDKVTSVGNLTVEQMGLHTAPLTVKHTDSVLSVLELLNKMKLMAIPVVDDHGRLVGNFSASDLRGLYMEKFPLFLNSVGMFLQSHSPQSLHPITCTKETAVKDVVHLLSTKKLENGERRTIHRVYVVDEQKKPIGVVSNTDVMRFLCNVESQ